MLSCPLATPSNSLWLSNDHERYWNRFYLAITVSLSLHLAAVIGIWFYQQIHPQAALELTSGAPDLPLRVQLITQSSQASAAKPETSPPQESKLIETLAPSTMQTAKQQDIPQTPKKIAPVQEKKKEALTQNNSAQEVNSQAGAPQKSTVTGASETPVVTSKPRYRSAPQQPEYPLQARKRKQEGVVLLYITVEPDGRTSSVSVQRSSGYPLLDKAAVAAGRKWEMYPHEVNGQAIRAIFPASVEFEIK